MVYLTGVRQPGTLAAISSAEGSGKGAFTLFVPDASQSATQWEGPPLNTAAAEEIFGANAAFPMSQVCALHTAASRAVLVSGGRISAIPTAGRRRLPAAALCTGCAVSDPPCRVMHYLCPLLQLRSRLPGFLAGAKSVLCDLGRARDSPVLVAALQAAKLDDARIRSLRPVMHRLRWVDRLDCSRTLRLNPLFLRHPSEQMQSFDRQQHLEAHGLCCWQKLNHSMCNLHRWRKSAAELDLMRNSAAIAASGIQLAMQRTRPGMFEFQIASTFGKPCGLVKALPTNVN